MRVSGAESVFDVGFGSEVVREGFESGNVRTAGMCPCFLSCRRGTSAQLCCVGRIDSGGAFSAALRLLLAWCVEAWSSKGWRTVLRDEGRVRWEVVPDAAAEAAATVPKSAAALLLSLWDGKSCSETMVRKRDEVVSRPMPRS